MVLIAKNLGIKFNSLNIINIAPPLYNNAVASESIQAGLAWSPYSSTLAASGYQIASWASDYSPDGGVCPGLTGVRAKFLAEHPDVGLKLVQVYAKAMDMISKNP